MVGYVFWLQVLNWIPQDVWNDAQACINRGDDDCTGLRFSPLYLSMAIAVIVVSRWNPFLFNWNYSLFNIS